MSFEIAAGATVVARKVKLIGISAHLFLAAELRAWEYAGLTPRGLVTANRLSDLGAATNRHAAEITNRFLIVFSPFRSLSTEKLVRIKRCKRRTFGLQGNSQVRRRCLAETTPSGQWNVD